MRLLLLIFFQIKLKILLKPKKFQINIIDADLTLKESFAKLESSYDYLYMLASVVGVNKCISFPHEVIRINTLIIQNTLDWLTKGNVKKVLFSSSSECYASATDFFSYPVPTSEKVPMVIEDISHPRFTYAVTKMMGESAFLNYSRFYDFDISIVRYQNIYGPRMGFNHVIPHLVQRFFEKKRILLKFMEPNKREHFVFVSDAVNGTVLAMESESSNNEIFHIGTTNEVTIEKIVKDVGRLMKYNGAYEFAETYPGSVSRRCPDISKASKILGYKPNISLEEGLEITVDWYDNYFKSG